VQGTWYDATASGRLPALETDGLGFAASIEGGYPFLLDNGMVLEPQAQLVYQHVSLGDTSDVGGPVGFEDGQSLLGRIGVKLSKTWQLDPASDPDPREVEGWVRASLTNEFLGQPKAVFASEDGDVPFQADLSGLGFTLDAGFDAEVADDVSIFGSFDYEQKFDGDARAFGGEVGLKVRF